MTTQQPNFLHIQDSSLSSQPIQEIKQFTDQFKNLAISSTTQSIRNTLQQSSPVIGVFLYVWKSLGPDLHQLLSILHSHQALLTIPYRNVKNMEKHIRIHLKKQFGIQKRYLMTMTKITKEVWAIQLQPYCLSKLNQNPFQAYPSEQNPKTLPNCKEDKQSVFLRLFLLNTSNLCYDTDLTLNIQTKIKLSEIFLTLSNIYV